MSEANIFRIVSAADKELAHSAMVKYFLSMGVDDFMDYFGIERMNTPVKIGLEVPRKFKNQKRKSIKFDIALYHEGVDDDQMKVEPPLMIIENKFKATPTKEQIKVYDRYLAESGNTGCRKILMVFMKEQIVSLVSEYLAIDSEDDGSVWTVIS